MVKNSKLLKITVFFSIVGLTFLPILNGLESYLPGSINKLVKFSQVKTVSANTSLMSAGADAASTTNCSDNMAWTDPGLATDANDTTYVEYTSGNFDSGNPSDALRMTSFGFSLGSVTSIDGITVEVLGWTSAGGASYLDVFLLTGGARRGEDHATGSFPTSDPSTTYQSFGGATDDWYAGGTWTQAEIEATDFGVEICWSATANNTAIHVDHVRITVHYTAPAPADLSWETGATDFEIWAGATATSDASLTWDNGTLICSTSLSDDNSISSVCGSLNRGQKYRIQTVLENVGGSAANMAAGDFVDQKYVKTYWAGTSPTISASSDCGFNDLGTDNGSTTCNVAFSGNDVRITNTGGGNVQIAATTGTEGFMYLITTDTDMSLSDSNTFMNASIDSIIEDSSRITIGRVRRPGIRVRGWVNIRGPVKFR